MSTPSIPNPLLPRRRACSISFATSPGSTSVRTAPAIASPTGRAASLGFLLALVLIKTGRRVADEPQAESKKRIDREG